MHRLIKFFAPPVKKLIASDPKSTPYFARHFRRRLSSEERHKVQAILVVAAVKRKELTVSETVYWAVSEGIRRGLSDEAIGITENATYRVFEIGIDETLAELECV